MVFIIPQSLHHAQEFQVHCPFCWWPVAEIWNVWSLPHLEESGPKEIIFCCLFLLPGHVHCLHGGKHPQESVSMHCTREKSPKAGGSARPKEVCHWAYSGLEQCPNQTSWFPSRNVMHSFWKAHALQMKPHGELCRGATPLGLHITSHPRFSKSQWEVIALAAGRNFGGKVLCIWLVETRNQHHRNKNTRK